MKVVASSLPYKVLNEKGEEVWLPLIPTDIESKYVTYYNTGKPLQMVGLLYEEKCCGLLQNECKDKELNDTCEICSQRHNYKVFAPSLKPYCVVDLSDRKYHSQGELEVLFEEYNKEYPPFDEEKKTFRCWLEEYSRR